MYLTQATQSVRLQNLKRYKTQMALFIRLHEPKLVSLIAILLIPFAGFTAFAQQTVSINGRITDQSGQPISEVTIQVIGTNSGTTSNRSGRFNIRIPTADTIILSTSHIQYEPERLVVTPQNRPEVDLNITLQAAVRILDQLEVTDTREEEVRIQAGNISIDPKAARNVPSAFGDFSKVLATLPGVVSNSELSSTYSVRGGNFDENLVYVNDILVYRPFLIRAGQQEGLSFINPNLIQGVNFSSGGWQPKYGDKLSSSLNIAYKDPSEFHGSGTLGALGASAHLEGSTKDGKASTVFGVRHKNARYLLNTLDTEGQYLPRFTDLQSFSTFHLGDNKSSEKSTSMNLLLAYSQNRYFVEPEARETDFGTFNRSFRLFVAFEGREISEYDTYQAAVKLNHNFNNNLRTSFILSGIKTQERELFEVEGGYRLCDLNTDPGSAGFNECAVIRGVGTDFSFGRNTLDATIVNLDNRSAYIINDKNRLEFGLGYSNESIDDTLNEFNFTDSANFSTINERISNDADLNSHRLTGYVQHTVALQDSVHYITYGARLNYWSLNEELLISPRFQYALQPKWAHNTVFRTAIGRYVQPPFYRELRDRSGVLNTDIKAQTSWHFITGIDHIFSMWGRDFKLLTEAYYKRIDNVIAYDIDNVRLRYFGNNEADAFATGLDFRINGEFIPGAESWFSLGILKTREDIKNDGNDDFRRPSDQLVNMGIFFQDHLPNDPSFRVFLSFLYGSGLPFGPPNNDDFRNSFSGDQYLRADLGLSKVIELRKSKKFESIWLGIDILNLFGINNTISYTWISDLNRNQFAVPNSLSARFFNGKVIVNF